MNNDKQFTDTERLEWLVDKMKTVLVCRGRFRVHDVSSINGSYEPTKPSFRSAIDAEMAREAGTK